MRKFDLIIQKLSFFINKSYNYLLKDKFINILFILVKIIDLSKFCSGEKHNKENI